MLLYYIRLSLNMTGMRIGGFNRSLRLHWLKPVLAFDLTLGEDILKGADLGGRESGWEPGFPGPKSVILGLAC